MSRLLSIHEIAEAEINDAADFYDRVSLGLGTAFINEIQRAIQDIDMFPEATPLLRGRILKAILFTHHITMPMVIWLMVSFFESMPAELEEEAMIDGCTRWQSFLRIVLPLVRNGIATSAIMSFIFSWNQFLFSLILSGPKTKTVPVAVYNFISYGKIDWAGIGAAATLIVLPVSVFAFFVRKSIVQGLTMGALKD
jgi:ABC-type glycerol-3-phosphate transport system permease component